MYQLAHCNSLHRIGPVFNVGKATVIETVLDVVRALFELKDQYIHFPETADCIETFRHFRYKVQTLKMALLHFFPSKFSHITPFPGVLLGKLTMPHGTGMQ